VAKAKRAIEWRLLFLLPIPLLWIWAAHVGYLEWADNRLLDLRYRYRGEISAPVKVVYVDIDTQAMEALGNFPWPRSHFAEVGAALVEHGGVRAVGVDVVFSEKGISESYDYARWLEGNIELYRFLRSDPPFVIAMSYAASEKRDAQGNRVRVPFPFLRDGLPPLAQIDPPELPYFSLGENRTWRPARLGLIDTIDGASRWIPLFAPTAENFFERFDHLSLSLALLYWGVGPDAVKLSANTLEVTGPDGRLLARIPLTDGQLMEVNWFSRWESPHNPRISFVAALVYARALQSEIEEERTNARMFFEQFKDAVVLIGPVDPMLQDVAATPLNGGGAPIFGLVQNEDGAHRWRLRFDNMPVPKVGIHGNALKTIVSGLHLQRLSPWAQHGLTLALTLVLTALATIGGTRSLAAKLTAVLTVVAFIWIAFDVFRSAHLVLPMAAPLGAAFTTAFAGVIWQLMLEERQKGRIKDMFSAYLAPAVVNHLVESEKEPELGGHEEVITAYFSDIQGFSTFSEKMSPARLVELMNEYLTACTDIVQEEGGTLDKYIGDAIVAMYGAPLPLPDHAYRACVSTIRVQQRLEELRQKWRSEGDKWPSVVHTLRARLGLNSGPAIIGNMGSRTRFSYTMMGDNVNLAARMESGAKLMGVYTMVTDSTRTDCEKHGGDRIVFRFLDKIVVKGRSMPVPVHEVVGFRSELSAQTFECLEIHARAIERYLAQDWDGAISLFEQSARLEPLQPSAALAIESNPSVAMIARCHAMKLHPPGAGWDGVFVMKEKG
jgi:adenylate cyclase